MVVLEICDWISVYECTLRRIGKAIQCIHSKMKGQCFLLCSLLKCFWKILQYCLMVFVVVFHVFVKLVHLFSSHHWNFIIQFLKQKTKCTVQVFSMCAQWKLNPVGLQISSVMCSMHNNNTIKWHCIRSFSCTYSMLLFISVYLILSCIISHIQQASFVVSNFTVAKFQPSADVFQVLICFDYCICSKTIVYNRCQ